MKPSSWKVVRMSAFILGACLAAILLGLFLVMLYLSPGLPPPFLDESGKPIDGSISEKLFVPINGVEQGLFLRGKDLRNPVLLFVHGGPGMPEFWLNLLYPTALEEIFTVCWWDQRGAGISNIDGVQETLITMDQLVSDTLEVTRYLQARFGQDKIFLLGHSFGSVIALQAAAKAPELYRAYIGMGQVTRQMDSELLANQYMVEALRSQGDLREAETLQRFAPPWAEGLPRDYEGIRDSTMHQLGIGTTRTMRSVITGIFLPVLASPAYTLSEKVALWRGKWSANSARLWTEMLHLDLPRLVPRLKIPAYFIHGAYDYTVSYQLLKTYFNELEAPAKGLYTFPDSAHSPLFEDPDRARTALREIRDLTLWGHE